jgi:hypothetical protein
VSAIIKDDLFWRKVMRIVKTVLPCLNILRLANHNKAGMDQLYYNVRSADDKVKRAAAYIDEGDMWGFEAMNALNKTSEDKQSD